MDEPIRFEPTYATGAIGEGRRTVTIRVQPDLPPMKAGQQVPLIWEDGVTTLEVVSVAGGVIELRSAN